MNDSHNTAHWSDREWLAFLLIASADADGVEDIHEMRFIRVGLGGKLTDRMHAIFAEMSPEDRENALRESLPQRLQGRKEREKVQKLLQKMVLADGEYGPEEQALVRRISNWLRGEAG
jgi:uncharacterized tellurite resistance protein B-like protein